jgi:hypothetical protein
MPLDDDTGQALPKPGLRCLPANGARSILAAIDIRQGGFVGAANDTTDDNDQGDD